MKLQDDTQCTVDLDLSDVDEGDFQRLVEFARRFDHQVDVEYRPRGDFRFRIFVDFGADLAGAQALVREAQAVEDTYGNND
ncbi:hypothetical protein [Streptomyces sp. Agncl-13]|uniref:hypothetical protein n=1 Tax=Streptomyces sp. Agncl-13 TaxID=3400628 RepID=UPI003A84E415